MELVSSGQYNTYKNNRQEPYFTYVKEGRKTIEGRLRKNEYVNLKPGDHILVHHEDEVLEVIVKDIRNYKNFRDLLTHESIQNVLPNVTSIEEGEEIYSQFYSIEDQNKFGVIAIEVLLKSK